MIPRAPVAVQLTRSWIRLYTLGLGAEARAERLAEVNSDLWEHALDDDLNGVAASGTAQEMLFRLVSGMPADVAWRFEQRSPVAGGKDMLALVQKNSWQRNSLWGLSFLLIGFLLVTGVGIAIGMESSLAVKLAYGSAVFFSGILMLAGFALTRRQPRLGAAMLVIGALLGSLLMWWFFFVPPLVALVVAIFGVRRARRFLGETRPNPPRPGPGLHA